MKIVGFSFDRIFGERSKEETENLQKINTNIQIVDIKQSGSSLFKEGEILDFKYDLKITYEPNFATINLSGNLLILIEKEAEIKQILKDWKSKKIPENLRSSLMSIVLTKCNLKALQIEDDLSLPAHIPSPQIVKQEEKSDIKEKKDYIN